MLRTMPDDPPAPPDGDAWWAHAEALLSGTPDAVAERRLRRTRRRRLTVVVALLVVFGALAAAVGLLVAVGRNGSDPPDVPTWQAGIGFALTAAGTLVTLVAVVRQVHGLRRRRAWRSPLLVLNPAQRKDLLGQVRGRAPVDPGRVGLSRELAHHLLHQRAIAWINAGLVLSWVGQAVAQPAWWRVLTASSFAVLSVGSGVLIARDARRAREFLAAIPGDRHAGGVPRGRRQERGSRRPADAPLRRPPGAGGTKDSGPSLSPRTPRLPESSGVSRAEVTGRGGRHGTAPIRCHRPPHGGGRAARSGSRRGRCRNRPSRVRTDLVLVDPAAVLVGLTVPRRRGPRFPGGRQP